MKLNIFFEKSWSELGILAMNDFLMNVPESDSEDESQFDTVQTVTDNTISKIENLPTYSFGFTISYKAKFLECFKQNLGKKYLLVNEWITSEKLRDDYMTVVEFLNQGKELKEAVSLVQESQVNIENS